MSSHIIDPNDLIDEIEQMIAAYLNRRANYTGPRRRENFSAYMAHRVANRIADDVAMEIEEACQAHDRGALYDMLESNPIWPRRPGGH